MTPEERNKFWDGQPESRFVQASGIIDRRDLVRLVVSQLDKPRMLEIGVDRGGIFEYCHDLLGAYTGVDVYTGNASKEAIGNITPNYIQSSSSAFWRGLTKDDVYDIVFVDGDHGVMPAYIDITQAMFRLSDQGYILAHDTEGPNEDVDTYVRWSHHRLCNINGWTARFFDRHPEGMSLFYKAK